MQATKTEANENHREDWLSLFRCCSRDPAKINRMVKALKQQLEDNRKDRTKE